MKYGNGRCWPVIQRVKSVWKVSEPEPFGVVGESFSPSSEGRTEGVGVSDTEIEYRPWFAMFSTAGSCAVHGRSTEYFLLNLLPKTAPDCL